MESVKKNKNTKTTEIVLCGLFAALSAAGAFIKIPVPYIPITMQVFFTTLAGLLLGKKLGSTSVLVYVILGLAGLPVFTKGGGIGYIFEPTFGYIIGFVLGAFVTGLIAGKQGSPSLKRLLAASYCGLAVIYACGIVYFYMISNLYLGSNVSVKQTLMYCFVLVVPGDIIMNFFAAVLAKRLIPALNFSRR
ncbi:MAG: biotin transporter BioY [Oscillospiraceae bacterium]|nr:biotin transporter BioY [Oscillospiraceae bacterium]